MGQTYLDDEALNILREVQKEMKESGIKRASLGDAVRRLKQNYDLVKQGNGIPCLA